MPNTGIPRFRSTLQDGTPNAYGYVYTWQAGTSTPKDTYSDSGLLAANTWPVQLDANGEAWIFQDYYPFKMDVQTSGSVSLPGWPKDNLVSASVDTGTQLALDLANTTSASLGDKLVGVKQPLTGATARTQHDKNLDYVTAKDFGLFDGITSDLTAINNAITAVANGGTVIIPDGNVNFGTGLVISKPVTIMLGAGDYTASANPVISGTVRSIHVIGKGQSQLASVTNIVAASASGNAISFAGNTSYDLGSVENLNIVGNSTADVGLYLQGQAKGWFTVNNVWVEGFTKALSGKGISLSGAITFQFNNCTASGNTIGVNLSTSGSTSSNLNIFDSCNFVANTNNIYIGEAAHANLFLNCNIAQSTSSPSVYVEYANLTTFDNCYFEANAAGLCVIQVGHTTNDGILANKTVVRNSYIAESSAITSFMHVYNGQACGVENSRLSSSAAITNLVYFDNPNSNFGYVANNYGNYPSTQVAGPRLSYALWIGGDIYKNASGIGRIDFGVPFAPKQCTVAQFGTGSIAPNSVGTVVYATNGRKSGEGAGAGTGVLAIYTNGAYRDPSQNYAVVVA